MLDAAPWSVSLNPVYLENRRLCSSLPQMIAWFGHTKGCRFLGQLKQPISFVIDFLCKRRDMMLTHATDMLTIFFVLFLVRDWGNDEAVKRISCGFVTPFLFVNLPILY